VTDEQFRQRYMITSVRGVVWGRKSILIQSRKLVRRLVPDYLRKESLREVDRVLRDDAFVRPWSGSIPARLIDAVAFEAWARAGARERR
jgi:hypothetical protein